MKKDIDRTSSPAYNSGNVKAAKTVAGEGKVTAICYYLDERLKDLIVKECRARGMSMNELISEIVASQLGHPEFGKIPRKPPGNRPKLTTEASA